MILDILRAPAPHPIPRTLYKQVSSHLNHFKLTEQEIMEINNSALCYSFLFSAVVILKAFDCELVKLYIISYIQQLQNKKSMHAHAWV